MPLVKPTLPKCHWALPVTDGSLVPHVIETLNEMLVKCNFTNGMLAISQILELHNWPWLSPISTFASKLVKLSQNPSTCIAHLAFCALQKFNIKLIHAVEKGKDSSAHSYHDLGWNLHPMSACKGKLAYHSCYMYTFSLLYVCSLKLFSFRKKFFFKPLFELLSG